MVNLLASSMQILQPNARSVANQQMRLDLHLMLSASAMPKLAYKLGAAMLQGCK
jgi:hypothetical protein